MSLIQIHVNQEYYDLIPRPTKEQYESLKFSIEEDGQHLPIIVNQNGTIMDGHTRYDICKELGIKPVIETKKFDNRFDEKHFVIITNLSRRNLTLFQRAELLFDWYVREKHLSKKKGGERMWQTRQGLKKPASKSSIGRLHKKMGKMMGCTHTQSFKCMKLIENADSKVLDNLREGKITIGGAFEKVFKPNWKKIKDYGYDKYRNRNKICLACGSDTKLNDIKECHVHVQICCTKCEWGC